MRRCVSLVLFHERDARNDHDNDGDDDDLSHGGTSFLMSRWG